MEVDQAIRSQVLSLSRENTTTAAPLRFLESKVFELIQGDRRLSLRSMLEPYELNLLYILAKDHYLPGSYIVDAGCLFVASTLMMCQGIRDGSFDLTVSRPVQCFDLFETNPPYDGFLRGFHDFGPTSNALYSFLALNRGNLDMIAPHQGDFLHWNWSRGSEISILFNDLSKTINLNNAIVKRYFSSLVPGKSFVVQQDYVHFAEWWIAVTMEYFKDYFDEYGYYFGATKLFRLRSRLPDAVDEFDLRDFSFSTLESLLARAISRAPATVAEALRTALGMFYIDNDKPQRALEVVLPMKLDEEVMHKLINSDVPKHENFANILPSNRRNVIRYAREGIRNAV